MNSTDNAATLPGVAPRLNPDRTPRSVLGTTCGVGTKNEDPIRGSSPFKGAMNMEIEIRRGEENAEACWHVRLKTGDRAILEIKDAVVKGEAIALAKALKFGKITANGASSEEPDAGLRRTETADGRPEFCLGESIFRVIEEVGGDGRTLEVTLCEMLADAKIVWCPPGDDPAEIHRKDDRTKTRGIPGS